MKKEKIQTVRRAMMVRKETTAAATELNFKLVKPCQNCPFLKNDMGYLTKKRISEIVKAIEEQDELFPCHKTINYNESYQRQTTPVSVCAGSIAYLEKRGTVMQNWKMRLARWMKTYDPKKVDRSQVCSTLEELTTRHCY